jgi:putative FmdB family regulatory protein
MPIFEYACSACGNEFETLVRSGSTPDCPSCHSTKLDKKLSATARTASPQGGAADVGACGHVCGSGSCSMH